MEFDEDKIDDAVLAVLYLTLHDGYRAWKGVSWDSTNRLFEKGLIDNPRGRAKSVAFTEEGLRAAAQAAESLFGRPDSEA